VKHLIALALAFALLPSPATAGERLVKLTMDGRPVDRAGGIAVLRNGIVYADVVDLVKTFDGLVTFGAGNAARIEIRDRSGTFTPGQTGAVVGGVRVVLPGAPFMRNGDLYVPLEYFIAHVTRARVLIDPAQTRADIIVNMNPLPAKT
jgi:hypothetical protein